MSHLSPAEFVDAAEGGLAAGPAAHLETCARCREQAGAVRSALDTARGDEPAEPSPLYWHHLSSRIHERVAQERIVPAWRVEPWRQIFGVHGLVPVVSAVALAVAVMAAGLMVRTPRPTPPDPNAIAGTAPADLGLQIEEDSEVWQVLTSAASEMPIEDAHAAGMTVATGTIDRAVQRMSPDELNELARLLKSELRGSGD